MSLRRDFGAWCLRGFRESDLESLCRHANNPRVSAQLRDRFPYPYTREDGLRWLEAVRDQEVVWAIATEDELIGAVGLVLQEDVYRRSAEIGYWLGEPYWGRGIATEAVREVTRHALEELGLIRVFAQIFETNPASMRVLEKAGYVREGRMRKAVVKRGRVLDQLLYART